MRYLLKEIIPPPPRLVSIHSLGTARFLSSPSKLASALKAPSLVCCSRQQQRLNNRQYQRLFPHGSARITKTQRGIFQPERQKHMRRSSPFPMTPATWKLAGARGERQVTLAPGRLAADGLAGINWLQLLFHFWPE